MSEARVGFGARLGALILDTVLAGVAATVALVIVATAGGVSLGVRYQEYVGGSLGWRSLVDGSFGRAVEERGERLVRELETEFTSRFSEEQARRMGDIASREMEDMFVPADLVSRGDVWGAVRRFASIDASTLNEAIDRVFAAVEREGIEGVTAADLQATRSRVDALVREMGLDRFLPDVIRYAVSVALIPLLVLLAYGLVEALVGASPGKLVSGLRIGDLDGRKAGIGITFVRYLVKTSPYILVAVAVALRQPLILPFAAAEWAVLFFGGLAMLGTERRALHDYMVGTAVYRASEMAEKA